MKNIKQLIEIIGNWFKSFFLRKEEEQVTWRKYEKRATKAITTLPDWLIAERKQRQKAYDALERVRVKKVLRAKIKRLTLALDKWSDNPKRLEKAQNKLERTKKELEEFMKKISPKRFFFF